MKLKVTESGEQQALVDWANAMIATGKYPDLYWLFAIPNGGLRNKATAIKLKREGVRAGVPDLCLPIPRRNYHGLFIELKVGRRQPSEQQGEWIRHLMRKGYRVCVAYGFEDAQLALVEYLK